MGCLQDLFNNWHIFYHLWEIILSRYGQGSDSLLRSPNSCLMVWPFSLVCLVNRWRDHAFVLGIVHRMRHGLCFLACSCLWLDLLILAYLAKCLFSTIHRGMPSAILAHSNTFASGLILCFNFYSHFTILASVAPGVPKEDVDLKVGKTVEF